MDHKIHLLRIAHTSTEIKDAVDALPRADISYTTAILNVLQSRGNIILSSTETSSDAVDAVASFLRAFARINPESLRTAATRDFIINVLAPNVSDGDAIQFLGLTLVGIIQSRTVAALYSDRTCVEVLLRCFLRASSSLSAQWIVSPINNICFYGSVGTNRVFNEIPTIRYFSALIPDAASSDSVFWIAHTLQKAVIGNEPLREQINSDKDFLNQLKSMTELPDISLAAIDAVRTLLLLVTQENPVTFLVESANTSTELAAAVEAFPRSESLAASEYEKLRDVLLRQKRHLISDGFCVAFSIAKLIAQCVRHWRMIGFKSGTPWSAAWATPEARDLIIDLLVPKVETISIIDVGECMWTIIESSSQGKALYMTRESVSALVHCLHLSKTEIQAEWFMEPLRTLAAHHHSELKEIWVNMGPAVADAFEHVIPLFTVERNCSSLCYMVERISSSSATAAMFFSTPSFLEKFATLRRLTNAYSLLTFEDTWNLLTEPLLFEAFRSADTSEEFAEALNTITQRHQLGITATRMKPPQDLLVSKMHLMSTENSVVAATIFVQKLGHKKYGFSSGLFDLVEKYILPVAIRLATEQKSTRILHDVCRLLETSNAAIWKMAIDSLFTSKTEVDAEMVKKDEEIERLKKELQNLKK